VPARGAAVQAVRVRPVQVHAAGVAQHRSALLEGWRSPVGPGGQRVPALPDGQSARSASGVAEPSGGVPPPAPLPDALPAARPATAPPIPPATPPAAAPAAPIAMPAAPIPPAAAGCAWGAD